VTIIIHDPGSLGFVIERLFAFVAVDAEGGEGVVGVPHPFFGIVPAIGADEARVRSLRPAVEELQRITGKRIQLVMFSTRTVIEELLPKEPPPQ